MSLPFTTCIGDQCAREPSNMNEGAREHSNINEYSREHSNSNECVRVQERCHWWTKAPESPWSRVHFALSFYTLKTTKRDEQVREILQKLTLDSRPEWLLPLLSNFICSYKKKGDQGLLVCFVMRVLVHQRAGLAHPAASGWALRQEHQRGKAN